MASSCSRRRMGSCRLSRVGCTPRSMLPHVPEQPAAALVFGDATPGTSCKHPCSVAFLPPCAALAATAITGVLQAVVGGQPLLIVGVSEPIVLVYKYMYDFAKDREGLGPDLYLAWCAWACVWTAAMVAALALTNACAYITRFTRFAGELFGALIAVRWPCCWLRCAALCSVGPGGAGEGRQRWHAA